MIDKALLDILACPACKSGVVLKDDRILCTTCGRQYPIKDDIPVMLVDGSAQTTGTNKEHI